MCVAESVAKNITLLHWSNVTLHLTPFPSLLFTSYFREMWSSTSVTFMVSFSWWYYSLLPKHMGLEGLNVLYGLLGYSWNLFFFWSYEGVWAEVCRGSESDLKKSRNAILLSNVSYLASLRANRYIVDTERLSITKINHSTCNTFAL